MCKNLSKKLKKLPKKSGVYIFQDKTGRILYIGKARDIQKRVKTHFIKPINFFTEQFIDKVTDLDWIKTDNEKQALLLENELIKKYQPRYNIQWRDDKSYFWVVFTDDEWPKVQIVHQNRFKNPPQSPFYKGGSPPLFKRGVGGDFIGPFVNGRELRQLLRALRKILPYRTCKNPYNKPCLQWHLGLCPAHKNPPHSPFSKGGRNVVPPLSQRGVRGDFKRQQKKYLNSLNTLSQFLRLYAGEPIRIEAYDISNIHGVWATGSMIVFYGDKPQKSDYRRFKIKTVRGANDVAMLKEVLRRRFGHPEWPAPDLILIDGGKAQLNAAKLEVRGRKLEVPIFALAKIGEELYTEYSNKALKLNALPLSLKLSFQAILNEAHRFAIFYYRYLHRRNLSFRP